MYLWLVCLFITFLFSRAHLRAININQQATDRVPRSLTCCTLLLARHACPCSTQTYTNEVTLSAHTDGTTATCCHGCAITLYHPFPPQKKKKKNLCSRGHMSSSWSRTTSETVPWRDELHPEPPTINLEQPPVEQDHSSWKLWSSIYWSVITKDVSSTGKSLQSLLIYFHNNDKNNVKMMWW